jgi:hypothetical protein
VVYIIWVITVLEDVVGILCIDLPIMAAISLFMDTFAEAPLILPVMQDPKSLTRC